MATKGVKKAAKKPAKNPAKANPVGRPTKYKTEYADLAYKFCLMGATDKKLAEFFSVDERSINEWKQVHPEFSQSLYNGREKADAEIAHSLYHRAKGYEHPEDDIKMFQGGIIVTPTVKHYPPDTGAATLWLKNRQSQAWRDKVDIEQKTEHSGTVGVDLSPSDAYLAMLNGNRA